MLCLRLRAPLKRSPSSVIHISVAIRKRPGMTMIHQQPASRLFSVRESMLPHEIISSGSPIPRKLRVDSATIAPLMFMITMNMIEEKKFGAR